MNPIFDIAFLQSLYQIVCFGVEGQGYVLVLKVKVNPIFDIAFYDIFTK